MAQAAGLPVCEMKNLANRSGCTFDLILLDSAGGRLVQEHRIVVDDVVFVKQDWRTAARRRAAAAAHTRTYTRHTTAHSRSSQRRPKQRSDSPTGRTQVLSNLNSKAVCTPGHGLASRQVRRRHR